MRAAVLISALCLGSAVSAQENRLLCVMALECYETDACQMTSFGFDLTLTPDEDAYLAIAEADAETMSGRGYDLGDGGYLALLSSEIGPLMLTIDKGNFARLSIHGNDEAVMVNYTGSCGPEES